jgi:putative hydrolase of the HAD superfamily
VTRANGERRIQAVIFDWGGTLSTHASSIRMEQLWATAAAHLAPHCGHPDDALAAALAAAEDAFWQRTAGDARSGTLLELVEAALQSLGVDVHPSVRDEAAGHYLEAWTPHIEHDPHAAETLVALRERGIRTALLSNTHWPRHYHERFLARDGLDGLLDMRLYTCELDYMKPHPSAFRAALDALGVDDPSRALFVGDRPWDDIYGASRAGLRTALRPNPAVPAYDVTPDLELPHLPDLIGHLDAWDEQAGNPGECP